MKTILVALSVFVLSFHGMTQEFPSGWIGNYQGVMQIGSVTGMNDSIPVDFIMKEVELDSIWTYTMQYHSARFGEVSKDYRIVRKKKGDSVNFLFDELNGILMEMSLLNNCLYGMYDVDGQSYISTMRPTVEGLFIELIIIPRNEPLVTKAASEEETEEEFIAESFKPFMHQSVHLKRIGKP